MIWKYQEFQDCKDCILKQNRNCNEGESRKTISNEARKRPQFCFISFVYSLKSGIGSCIAQKAGLARHPAKGRYGAEISGFYSSGV